MTRTTRTPAPDTGLDAFLAWAAAERGAALPVRPADAVLTLLALRGADRRSGVPEPTPELLRRVLLDDLPGLLWATPEERAAMPALVTALADHVRAARRLNAKRHERVLAVVLESMPAFERAMTDPRNLTWPRWYASLLRADGTDADDPEAVRGWLAAHARRPHADRPQLPSPVHRSDLTARTFAARTLLIEALLADDPAAGPDRLESLATELTDRWTAVGLGEALTGPHADLAPGPEDLPHLALADRMLDEHLDYFADSAVPLPPPPALPAPEEIRALLHAAPLPVALATGTAGEDLRELAERCGFPGPATVVWTQGTAQELTELGADILAGLVERIPSAAAPDEEYALDAAHILYTLYERGSTPESVARKASDLAGWKVAPEFEELPVPVPDSAPAAYSTPAAPELATLLALPDLTDTDRTELDGHAHALADLVDRLAQTGCVFRTGDAYGLTPLGSAVMRHILAGAGIAAPDHETAADWNAAETAAAVQHWPPAIAAATLTAWTTARGGTDEAWSELLNAVSAAKSADFPHTATPALFARLSLAAVPAAALRAALTDPVIGAYAHRLLHDRGEPAGEELVLLTARATRLLEDLDAHWTEDMRAFVTAAAENRDPDPVPTALIDAFDTAAAGWPGGPAALLEALAEAHPPTSLRVLQDLHDRHPDNGVANAAAHAVKWARTTKAANTPKTARTTKTARAARAGRR
ncbi:hypothetical protein [Streptomyces sp. FIT100]|uniref:hypothetical protein n=1 Tax=Streptomyces sp. FIT100 TaxID=2837956 RepID=UPI0021CA5995|nr:hypothetical protein [Streptomyces sp. FIT100]